MIRSQKWVGPLALRLVVWDAEPGPLDRAGKIAGRFEPQMQGFSIND